MTMRSTLGVSTVAVLESSGLAQESTPLAMAAIRRNRSVGLKAWRMRETVRVFMVGQEFRSSGLVSKA